MSDLEKSNGIKPAGKAQAISVHGVQGRSVIMQSVSPFSSTSGQQVERDWLVVFPQSNDTAILFVFVAPEAQFQRFQPTYEAMLKSVQF